MTDNIITKTFTITASKEVMQRFEKFMCFLHYNGGHTATFAMPFDGDGSDRFECDPPPDKGTRDWSHISDVGHEIEIALNDSCKSIPVDHCRPYYLVRDNKLYKIHNNGERELRKEYDEPAPLQS
jgi:hypothetical protein